MSSYEKIEILALIEGSDLARALKRLDIPKSTYYRWMHRFRSLGIQGLEDSKPKRHGSWNRRKRTVEYTPRVVEKGPAAPLSTGP